MSKLFEELNKNQKKPFTSTPLVKGSKSSKFSTIGALFSFLCFIFVSSNLVSSLIFDYLPDVQTNFQGNLMIGIFWFFPLAAVFFTVLAFIKKEQSKFKWVFLILLGIFVAEAVIDFIQHPLGGYFIG